MCMVRLNIHCKSFGPTAPAIFRTNDKPTFHLALMECIKSIIIQQQQQQQNGRVNMKQMHKNNTSYIVLKRMLHFPMALFWNNGVRMREKEENGERRRMLRRTATVLRAEK